MRAAKAGEPEAGEPPGAPPAGVPLPARRLLAMEPEPVEA